MGIKTCDRRYNFRGTAGVKLGSLRFVVESLKEMDRKNLRRDEHLASLWMAEFGSRIMEGKTEKLDIQIIEGSERLSQWHVGNGHCR